MDLMAKQRRQVRRLPLDMGGSFDRGGSFDLYDPYIDGDDDDDCDCCD